MGGGITWTDGIDGAETIGATCNGRQGNIGNIVGVWCEFGYNRNIDNRFNRGRDFFYHLRVLTHGHTVAFGMGAGQIKLQAIGHWGHYFGYLDKFLDTATKDRYQ